MTEDSWDSDEATRFSPRITGPRRWWTGPLDVEGLAISAVSRALEAANAAQRSDRHDPRHLGLDTRRIADNYGSLHHLRVDGRAPERFAEMSGSFPCRNGWVRTHANYPHHRAMLTDVLGAVDAAALRTALRERDAAEVEDAVTAHGGLAVRVRIRQEWLDSPMGSALNLAHPAHASSPASARMCCASIRRTARSCSTSTWTRAPANGRRSPT